MMSHRLHGCHKRNYYVSRVAFSMASPDRLPNLVMGHMTLVTTHTFKKLACRELNVGWDNVLWLSHREKALLYLTKPGFQTHLLLRVWWTITLCSNMLSACNFQYLLHGAMKRLCGICRYTACGVVKLQLFDVNWRNWCVWKPGFVKFGHM